ncbi:MAG: hypothetical protein AAFX04_03420 [Pseudomonadota bacterium]
MSLTAALLLATSTPLAVQDVADQPYPLDAVLQAFATACATVEDPAVNIAAVKAGGWEAYTPESDTIMGRIIAFGRNAVENETLAEGEEPTEILDNGVYRQEVAGRSLHLVLSGAKVGTVTTTGCRLYDFEATIEPEATALERWARRAPDAETRPIENMAVWTWNGGMKPGHFDMQIYFVQPGATLPGNLPITGLVLTASSMEIEGL